MLDLLRFFVISTGRAWVIDEIKKNYNSKTMNKQVLKYIYEKFVMANTIHNHNLRDSEHNLFIPRPNTEALKKSFAYSGVVLWNARLSPQAKQAPSV